MITASNQNLMVSLSAVSIWTRLLHFLGAWTPNSPITFYDPVLRILINNEVP
jgi:hypothetical protein